MPVALPIVAISVPLRLHVPPPVTSERVLVVPPQSAVLPRMPVISPTVITTDLLQPEAIVYVIPTVPLATPVTRPVSPTVAMPVLPLLHVPPVDASDSVEEVPVHTEVLPSMGNIGLTVTIAVV